MRCSPSSGGPLGVLGAAAVLLLVSAPDASAIPSFARQTKLPCSACHTQFPELNEFGRVFKLNAYTLTAIEQITAQDTAGHQDLALNLMPIVSIMAQVSWTQMAKAIGGSPNGMVLLPDQLSVFLAGSITPKLGAFVQLTYDPQSGAIDLDNTSLRFATQGSLAAHPTTFGLSVNNNPTVQDLWNSTPVWGFPYAASSVAPTPAAATLIDGTLAGEVAGISGFAYWNSAVYGEVGAYRSSPLGTAQPFDNTASGIIDGVAPYWRVALTKSFGNNSLEIGTYGITARRQPGNFIPNGATDRFTDLALDFQYQRMMGNNSFTATGTWIHESRTMDASFASGAASVASQTLNTFRVRGTYHFGQRYGLSVMPFVTNGTADGTLYASTDSVANSASGSPNSAGAVAELDWMPWQNTRLAVQYTLYTKFNGGTTDYNGAGRDAANNNTLYVLAWLMF